MSVQQIMIAASVTLALGIPAFADGGNTGGLGPVAHVSQQLGRAAGNDISSTGIVSAAHSGGIGRSTTYSGTSAGISTNTSYSAGLAKSKPGGIGRATDGTQGKAYNVPMIHGVGPTAVVSGGRGF